MSGSQHFKWLLDTKLPNNRHVYVIFDTRAGALEYAYETIGIPSDAWRQNVGGDFSYHSQSGYSCYITQEDYYGQ